MSCYVYCLYSTADGRPRYVGRASDKVSYRYNKHITAALEKEPGALYDWIRDLWRDGNDVAVHTLQESITPKDLDLFEQYWINQFSNLFNIFGNTRRTDDTATAQQIIGVLQAQLQSSRKTPS
jgi:hypothetical protein